MRKKVFWRKICIMAAITVPGTLVLTACGSDSSVANSYTKKTEVETTESTSEETTTTQQLAEIITGYQLTVEDDLADGFSEGRCWVKYKDGGEEYAGVIDDTGRLIYKYVRKDGDAYCGQSTHFQSGVTCLHSSDNKFFIIDKEGKILYECPNATEAESYFFIGQYKDIFLIEKHVQSFSENSYFYQIIDKNGDVVSEYKMGGRGSCKEFSDGIYYTTVNTGEKNGVFGYKEDGLIIIDMNTCKITRGSAEWGSEYPKWDEKFIESKLISDDGTVYVEKNEYFIGGLEYNNLPEIGYYDKECHKVVSFSGIPESVKIENGSHFIEDVAIIELKGADNKTYVTAINKKGEMQYEPIKVKRLYYGLSNINGHTLVVLPDDEKISVVSPQGKVLSLGIDDCSELGKETVYHDGSTDHNLISNGYIRMNSEMIKAHGLDDVGVCFVSLDGKKTITSADIYSDSELAKDIETMSDDSSTLNGTYSTEVLGGISKSYFTFKGNKITMSAFGIEADGTYKINNNKLYINYTMLGKDYDISYSFKKEGDKLYIGGDKFVKE